MIIAFLSTCFLSVKATESDVTTAPSPAAVNENEARKDNSSLIIEHVSSTVNSITIRWNSTGDKFGSDVKIEAHNVATKMTILSPMISSTSSDTFTIPDLAVDSEYRVCVIRIDDLIMKCDVIRTIPVMRLDTLLAVLLILAIIILLILTAFICWRCAVYHASPHDDPEVCDNDNGKLRNASPTCNDQQLDEKVPLLAPGSKTATLAPNNGEPAQQAEPTTLYLFLASPAFDGSK